MQEQVIGPVERIRNDCVAAFFAVAAEHFLGPAASGTQWFDQFANRIEKNWASTRELPLLSEADARACFIDVMQDIDGDLALEIVRFRDIPYEGYYEFSQRQFDEGRLVGVGYRSKPIFDGDQDALHVSVVAKVSVDCIYLEDADLAPNYAVPWETIEAAALSAGSGFWIVSKQSH